MLSDGRQKLPTFSRYLPGSRYPSEGKKIPTEHLQYFSLQTTILHYDIVCGNSKAEIDLKILPFDSFTLLCGVVENNKLLKN